MQMCAHTLTCTYTYTNTHSQTLTCVHTLTYTHTLSHTVRYTPTHSCTHIHTDSYSHIHMHLPTLTHEHLGTYTHTHLCDKLLCLPCFHPEQKNIKVPVRESLPSPGCQLPHPFQRQTGPVSMALLFVNTPGSFFGTS